jgi:hypothetical protein
MGATRRASKFLISATWIAFVAQSSAMADQKDDYTIFAAGSNGQPFQLDSGYMAKHAAKDEDPIAISLEGSGSYSKAAINVVRGEDWFPAFPIVDRVSFVCRWEERGMPKVPHVLFPTQSELEKGKGATVEIPCTMNAAQVREAMRKVQRFLRDLRDDPLKTAHTSRTLAADCDRNPKAAGCAQWKEITDLFSGTAGRPLMAAASYCGVSFGGGVEANQWLKAKAKAVVVAARPAVTSAPAVESSNAGYPMGSLGMPLTKEDKKAIKEAYQALKEWKKKNLPNCETFGSLGGFSGNATGFNDRGPDAAKPQDCLDDVDRAKAKLKAEGVKFLNMGNITLHDESCQFKADPTCSFAFAIRFAEEGALRTQATQAAADQSSPTKSDLALLQEKLDSYIGNKVSVVAMMQGSSNLAIRLGISALNPSSCGRDTACRKQEMIAENAFRAEGSILNPGCYIITAAKPGGRYGATFAFDSKPKDECELNNPFGGAF